MHACQACTGAEPAGDRKKCLSFRLLPSPSITSYNTIDVITIEDVNAAVQRLKRELLEIVLSYRSEMLPRPADTEAKITALPDIELILFDIYGTLLISAAGEVGTDIETPSRGNGDDALRRADSLFQAVFRQLGFSIDFDAPKRARELYFSEIEESHRRLKSGGTAHPEVNIVVIWMRILRTLSEEGLISPPLPSSREESIESAVRAALSYELKANVVSAMPGVIETIELLRNRGILLGIVSNAQFYTPLVMEALFSASPEELGFRREFSAWSWILGEAKPSARIFEEVLTRIEERERIPASHVLYVGNDMRNDIAPAGRLGCRTALFAGDTRSLRLREKDETLRSVEPDLILSELIQLSRVIPEYPESRDTFE